MRLTFCLNCDEAKSKYNRKSACSSFFLEAMAAGLVCMYTSSVTHVVQPRIEPMTMAQFMYHRIHLSSLSIMIISTFQVT
ncbi:hypothetical protein BD626DRAFT_492962 [Schizophyllum amplum]|uniref:Uncharacterized protein n=1 Tax=Schizophyllum amplum TaxID=97359 RepID=A0A550CGG2_9AGAR|nr:hypothetical protein BD626DRAFT_492962 [Auriculariopsis ampla]